jgi:riboflavin synthase
MFTGLIESVCKVVSAVGTAGGIRLAVDLGRTGETAESGDSIAINGTCLTIASIRGTVTEFDVSAETLSKTTLGNLKIGSPVNVERAMQVTDKFGGHFVQGHIDAVGKVKKIEKKGDSRLFVFQTNSDVLDYIIPKGSMAVDGVSLTITDVEKNGFGVAIIPATYENTIFKNYKVGDSVNIETDIICRIVKKQLDDILPNKQGLSVEKLKEMGF